MSAARIRPRRVKEALAGVLGEHNLPRRTRCPHCRGRLDSRGDCRACGYSRRPTADAWVRTLCDRDTFRPFGPARSADPLEFVGDVPYMDALAWTRLETGLDESVLVGRARIDRREVVLAVFDFRFFGGSLGVSAGEELVEALSTAAEARIPFVLVVSSTFSVIAPEGAAAILPGVGRSPAGWAESLKLAASDAYGLGLVDGVVSQPEGRRSGRALVRQLREVLAAGVHELLAMDPAGLTRARRDRYLVSTRHLLGPLPESGVDESWELGSLPRVAANG